ncbi:LamG-like jellyroll fold domain-containing protein [Nonomuraea sediminis]|uniref:LamG-like jellyroll fold domain-containing protein n=1 Tax=Nonomuraea sediminis TaxID=2835864 RepID=UPI001BDBFD7A|nr:LamG-like jellyroll fold domain-containing protein [Nonomuraea sediminis]
MLRILSAAAAITLAASLSASPSWAEEPTLEPSTTSIRKEIAQVSDLPIGDKAIETAKKEAVKTGKRVEIPDRNTEALTLYANPDGKTLRMELHNQPVRVKDADGKGFTPIDTTLVEEAGAIKPKAINGTLTLSAGQDRTLLKSQATAGADTAKITTPAALPKPTLKGSTAHYPAAYGKGRDLLVTATATGFRQQVVLTERPTGPVAFKMPVALPAGLSFSKNAQAQPIIVGKDGKTLTEVRPTLLQDAKAADAYGPIDAGKVGKAAVSLDGDGKTLVFTPDAAFLADPAVTYPVTMAAVADDWWETHTGAGGLPKQGWDTFVNDADYQDSWDNFPLDRILVGKSNSGTVRWRSYIKFLDMPAEFRGMKVQNADLILWNHLSNDCGDSVGSGVTTRRVTSAWDEATMTWNSQPSVTTTGQITEYGAYSPNCTSGAASWAGKEWDLIYSIDEIVQAWSDGAPNYGVQLTAGNESDLTNWRRYRTDEAGGCRTTPLEACKGQLHPPILTVDFEPPPPSVPNIGYWLYPGEPHPATADEIRAFAADPAKGRSATALPSPEDVSWEKASELKLRSSQDISTSADDLLNGPAPVEEPQPDATPPSVVTTSPARDATNTAIKLDVWAVFSEDVSKAEITLNDAAGNAVPGTRITGQGADFIGFTPTEPLTPGSVYAAQLSGVEDLAGNAMTPYSWSFTTDGTPPAVSSVSPVAEATDVPITTPITVTFSEVVTDAQFTLKDSGGSAIAGTSVMDNTDRVLTFTPAQPIAETSTYTAEVSSAKDLAGNALTAPYSWSFTTGAKPPTGLVAAYGMDEGVGTSVSDSSGHNNTGTATATSWQNGKYGKALSFNGTSSWVTAQDAASLRLESRMTLSAWVNPTTVNGWRSVVGKELQAADAVSYLLYASNGTVPSSWAKTSPAEPAVVNGTLPLPINTWSHLAATYDGAALRLFVNGQQVAEIALNGALVDDGSPLRIGGNQVWGEYFSGLIDEVRVYNRALSIPEIQADMNTPVGSATPDPDTTPPTVSAVSPVAGATGIPVTTPVTATFSEAVTDAQFTLKNSSGTAVAGSSAMDAAQRVLTFTPAQSLAENAAYTAVVSGAKDLAGNAIAEPYTWSFTTGTKPPSGLVAAYGMDEGVGTTVGDSSGQSNTGVARDTTWTTGKYGKALSFNGTSSWLTVEHAASLRLTNKLSLSAWVRPSTLDSLWRTVLMKEHAEGGVYGIYASSEYNSPAGWFKTTSEGGGLVGEDPLPLDQWSHLAVTYDGAFACLYVNGTLVSRAALTGDIVDDGGALRMGGNAFWDEFYTGLIDEVRIYNRVQSEAEIQADMNTPIGAAASRTPQELSLGTSDPAGIAKLTVDDSRTVDGVTTVSTLTPRLTTWLPAGRHDEAKVEVEISRLPAKASKPGKFVKTDETTEGKQLVWSGQATAKRADSRVTLQVPSGRLGDGHSVRWRARATASGANGAWTGWHTISVSIAAATPTETRPVQRKLDNAVVQSAPAADDPIPIYEFDRITPDDCKKEIAKAGRPQGWIKNHYAWCSIGDVSAIDSSTPNCRITFCQAKGKVMTIAHTFHGKGSLGADEAKGATSRDIVIDVYYLDKKLDDIYNIGIGSRQMTIGVNPVGTRCQHVTEFGGSPNLNYRTMSINSWDGSTARFRLRCPKEKADPTRTLVWEEHDNGTPAKTEDRANVEAVTIDGFRTYVNWPNWPGIQGYYSVSGKPLEDRTIVRCDSASYIAGDGGCIFDSAIPSIVFSTGSGYDAAYEHYWKACNDPNDTYEKPLGYVGPGGGAGKTIIQGCGGEDKSRAWLHRLSGDLADTYRRKYTRPKCIEIWGVNYTQNQTRQCDEYPFASTYERWEWSSLWDGDKPANPDKFSVCPIPNDDNKKAGDALDKRFYLRDRILHGDPFFVRFKTKIDLRPIEQLCGNPSKEYQDWDDRRR